MSYNIQRILLAQSVLIVTDPFFTAQISEIFSHQLFDEIFKVNKFGHTIFLLCILKQQS